MGNWFRDDLKDFKNYKADEHREGIFLNANESFIDLGSQFQSQIFDIINKMAFNRYPSSMGEELLKSYSSYCKVQSKNIMMGNGSDELIMVLCNAFLNGNDKVMVLKPDFSMYKIYTKIRGANVIEFELDDEFKLDVDAFIQKANQERPKIIFISVPNNPTGNIVEEDDIIRILKSVDSIVVIDEAYYEFYGKTVVNRIYEFENLVVLRTASKIGLAALRLGFLITNDNLIQDIYKVKSPYNVNSLTQSIGSLVFSRKDVIEENLKEILKQREYLKEQLYRFKKYIKIYPSYSNFFLIRVEDGQKLYNHLFNRNIFVRFFSDGVLENCIRITVGNKDEIDALIKAFEEFFIWGE